MLCSCQVDAGHLSIQTLFGRGAGHTAQVSFRNHRASILQDNVPDIHVKHAVWSRCIATSCVCTLRAAEQARLHNLLSARSLLLHWMRLLPKSNAVLRTESPDIMRGTRSIHPCKRVHLGRHARSWWRAKTRQALRRRQTCCSAAVGIDLGTTNSLVSIIQDGAPVVLPDARGRTMLPSVVAYSGGGAVRSVWCTNLPYMLCSCVQVQQVTSSMQSIQASRTQSLDALAQWFARSC